MRVYSYIVARDFGFAPNPFHGVCTLATCKPAIRRLAAIGDWVVGTGAKTRYELAGHLVFAMKVDEAMEFETYWADPRFRAKRPVLNGSLKQLYGDNIYHRSRGRWIQEDSHHSLARGRPNAANVANDTSADRVLLSRTFVYYGASAPALPRRFRSFGRGGEDVCCLRQGHRVLSAPLAHAFETWLESDRAKGLRGLPWEFGGHSRTAAV